VKEKEKETRQSRDLALNVSTEMCVKITISMVQSQVDSLLPSTRTWDGKRSVSFRAE